MEVGTSTTEHPTQVSGLGGLRTMTAGSVAQRVSSVLRGQRPGALAGTWALAVDASSVRYRVSLPCLGYAGVALSIDCELSWSGWLSRGATWAQIIFVLVLVSLKCALFAYLVGT